MGKKVKMIKAPSEKGPLTSELLGRFIKAKRTQSGLRLEDAALICGVAKETLSKIENARDGVRFDSVLQVCKMLGVELQVKRWNENE